MKHPLDPSDARLRTFRGPQLHKAICKTSKKIAPNHNTSHIQQSSSDSPPRVDVETGPVSYPLADISVFLPINMIYLPLVLLISLILAAHLVWKLLFHYEHACFLYLKHVWIGFLAKNTHIHHIVNKQDGK